MEKYYGNYLGIVVNTNDPENRNRIQVWVPNLTNTLYTNWNTDLTNKTLEYNFDDSDPVFIRLKNSLPWAECASPLIGGGTAMNINPSVKTQSTGNTFSSPVEPVKEEYPVPAEVAGIFDSNESNASSRNSGDGVPLPSDFFNESNASSRNSGDGVPLPSDFFNSSPTYEQGATPEIMEAPLPEADPSVVTMVPTGISPEGNPEGISPPNVNIQRYRSTLPSQQYGAGRNRPDPHAGIDLDNSPYAVSFIGGVVTRVGYDAGGYGNYVDIYNEKLGVVERVAEYTNPKVKLGDVINPYQVIGDGVDQTGIIHYEIRKDLNSNNQGGFGFKGTTDPVKYLNAFGIDPYSEQTVASIQAQLLNQSTGESNPAPITNSLDHSIAAQGNPSPAGAAKGVISTPSIGARVWMFFYGGDIQKPVYFAMSISASEYRQANQA